MFQSVSRDCVEVSVSPRLPGMGIVGNKASGGQRVPGLAWLGLALLAGVISTLGDDLPLLLGGGALRHPLPGVGEARL